MKKEILNKNGSMTDKVYQYIHEKIIYGDYGPGDLLQEGKLAKQLNVSKTPVREALNRLKYESLVDVIPYKGYLIANTSLSELRDLIELRNILESNAVGLAVKRISRTELIYLKQLASSRVNHDLDDPVKEFMKLNKEFHCFIGKVSGNKQIEDLIRHISNKLQKELFQDSKKSNIIKMEEEHMSIVKAIESGNEVIAKKRIHEHLIDSQTRILDSGY